MFCGFWGNRIFSTCRLGCIIQVWVQVQASADHQPSLYRGQSQVLTAKSMTELLGAVGNMLQHSSGFSDWKAKHRAFSSQLQLLLGCAGSAWQQYLLNEEVAAPVILSESEFKNPSVQKVLMLCKFKGLNLVMLCKCLAVTVAGMRVEKLWVWNRPVTLFFRFCKNSRKTRAKRFQILLLWGYTIDIISDYQLLPCPWARQKSWNFHPSLSLNKASLGQHRDKNKATAWIGILLVESQRACCIFELAYCVWLSLTSYRPVMHTCPHFCARVCSSHMMRDPARALQQDLSRSLNILTCFNTHTPASVNSWHAAKA